MYDLVLDANQRWPGPNMFVTFSAIVLDILLVVVQIIICYGGDQLLFALSEDVFQVANLPSGGVAFH